jgi:hypothetical protein
MFRKLADVKQALSAKSKTKQPSIKDVEKQAPEPFGEPGFRLTEIGLTHCYSVSQS